MKNGSSCTMSDGSSSPKRARLDFDDNFKEDHYDKYKNRDQEDQGSYTHSRRKRGEPDDDDLKDGHEMKAKNLPVDPGRREHTLVVRLTNKEQELQECMNQIQEMKQAQTQNTAQLRSMLLDPAINLVFQRMAREMDEHKEKLKQKQNELSAWKFTPDSQTGMRLMAKCRMLLQENGELGKMISSGRTSRLEGEISLQKALVTEMKKNQKELDEFVGELEEDVESMQGMILMLQQQLKEARELNSRLQQENEQLRASQATADTGRLQTGKESLSGTLSLLSKQPVLQVNSLMSKFTHLPSFLGGGSKDPEQTSLHKSPGNAGNLMDSSLSAPSSAFPLITSQASPDNLSPPAFKVTPDSGTQTQEEDDVSVDATDFLLTGGALKREDASSSPVNPAQTNLDFAVSRSALTTQSKGLLPTPKEEQNFLHDSLGIKSEYSSEKLANLSGVSNSCPSQIVRTFPRSDSGALRTDPLADPSQNNNLSGNGNERTSAAPVSSNGADVLTRKSDSDTFLNRTSCSNDQDVVSSVDSKEEVDKRCDPGVVSTVDKPEGDNSYMDSPFQMGLTNGSSKVPDGPDL